MILQVKNRIDSGEDVPDCLVKSLIEAQDTERLTWEDMCFICTAFTTGGVHSVSFNSQADGHVVSDITNKI